MQDILTTSLLQVLVTGIEVVKTDASFFEV